MDFKKLYGSGKNKSLETYDRMQNTNRKRTEYNIETGFQIIVSHLSQMNGYYFTI